MMGLVGNGDVGKYGKNGADARHVIWNSGEDQDGISQRDLERSTVYLVSVRMSLALP